MMMNYFTPTISTLSALTKRCGHLLLPLSFCILLIGCESKPSTSPVTNNTTAKQSSSNSENAEGDSDDPVEDEGESLIAAAMPNDPDDSVETKLVPMFSEDNPDSALQATLIGDYVGILSCSFCNAISVTLNLFADGSVLKTSVYQNPEEPTLPLAESGIYRQDQMMITVVYDNRDIESYAIQDNHLVMVNDDKSLNTDYTLSRK